jgi:hypothetical protein
LASGMYASAELASVGAAVYTFPTPAAFAELALGAELLTEAIGSAADAIEGEEQYDCL